MKTVRKPMPIIGIDKYTFFKVSRDSADGIEYEEPYRLPGMVEITMTDTGGSDLFDADNGAYAAEAYTENIGHEVEMANIPAEIDAMWRGLKTKNDAMVMDMSSDVPYFGVAWRLKMLNNKHRYFKCFKGSYAFASSVGGKTKPSSGASDKKTATATYTAVQPDYTDIIYMYIDEEDVKVGTGSGTDTDTFATIKAFEDAWFADMGTLLDDENITMKVTV